MIIGVAGMGGGGGGHDTPTKFLVWMGIYILMCTHVYTYIKQVQNTFPFEIKSLLHL